MDDDETRCWCSPAGNGIDASPPERVSCGRDGCTPKRAFAKCVAAMNPSPLREAMLALAALVSAGENPEQHHSVDFHRPNGANGLNGFSRVAPALWHSVTKKGEKQPCALFESREEAVRWATNVYGSRSSALLEIGEVTR